MSSPEPHGRTVLVVDDDPRIVRLLELWLRREGYRVETASDGREALAKAEQTCPSLVLLDLQLPVLDGREVCRRLRHTSDVPIIFVTALSDHADKVAGLDLGADDYVTKPFNPGELVARVRAVLRRYAAARDAGRVIRFADLVIDLDRRELRIGGRNVDLRPKELELLATLAGSPGVVCERERLLQLAWDYEWYGDTRTVDVHVAWLREKLARSQARIETVWGVGYKLTRADESTASSPQARRRRATTSVRPSPAADRAPE